MSIAPITRDRLRGALAAHGAAPRKRHGQNFLLDDNLLAAIVRDARLEPDARVLEIGPGPGLLTRHLLAAGMVVTAVEIDPLMHAIAQDLIEPELLPSLGWVEADVLKGTRSLSSALLEVLAGHQALVANLPYGITGPLLGCLAIHPDSPRRQVVMVQREMAERLVAAPGQRAYGPLAVCMALCTSTRVLRRVPARAFWPPPRVESALLEVDLLPVRPVPEVMGQVSDFLRLAFHNRRKTLANSVREAVHGSPGGGEVSSAFFDVFEEKSRAESLSPLQLYDLARTWAGCAQGERYRPGAVQRPDS